MTKKDDQQSQNPGASGGDAFQRSAYQGIDWVIKNQNALIVAGIGLFVVFVAYLGYDALRSGQEEDRFEKIGAAEFVYQKELMRAQDKRDDINEQIEALQKQIDAIKPRSDDKSAELTPTDQQEEQPSQAGEGETKLTEEQSTEKTRLEDEKAKLEEQLIAVQAEHQGSILIFEKVAEELQDYPQGWAAYLRLVGIHLEEDNFEKAYTTAEALVEASKETKLPLYAIQARFTLVSLAEQLEKWPEAIRYADALIEHLKGLEESTHRKSLLAQAELAKARVMLLENSSRPELKDLFEAIVFDHPGTAEAQKAQTYLALVGSSTGTDTDTDIDTEGKKPATATESSETSQAAP